MKPALESPRVAPLKKWELPWWQLAHQNRQRQPPTNDPVFLARLQEDHARSEVVFGACDLLILGSNPVLALLALAHCSHFMESIIVALANNPDHWNYPLSTSDVFARFAVRHGFVPAQASTPLTKLAQSCVESIAPSCKVGWTDLSAHEVFQLSKDEPSGLNLMLWGPSSTLRPWDRPQESVVESTLNGYEQAWTACLPAWKKVPTLAFPQRPVMCEGVDRPANVLASRGVLLTSSLPGHLSQTLEETPQGLRMSNEWTWPAVGSAAFISKTAQGHFNAPLRDLSTLNVLTSSSWSKPGCWPAVL